MERTEEAEIGALIPRTRQQKTSKRDDFIIFRVERNVAKRPTPNGI